MAAGREFVLFSCGVWSEFTGETDTRLLSPPTGENGEITLPSIRPNTAESALDLGPSDLLGADLGLRTNPEVMEHCVTK